MNYFHGSHSEERSNGMYQSIIINHEETVDAISQEDMDATTYLKWEIFNRHCHTTIQYPGNRINAQLKCDQFHGSIVKWEGTVINVEIKRVQNIFEQILTFLPDFLSKSITCWFGEPNELMYDVYDTDEMEYFKDQKCNLNNWNSYEFRIGIKMDYTSIELYLNAPHSFVNFTRLLHRSDRVWFKGKLITSYSNPNALDNANQQSMMSFNLEKHPIWIDLSSIGCVSCSDKQLNSFFATSNQLKLSSQNIYNGIKYLFNVLFNPLIKIN